MEDRLKFRIWDKESFAEFTKPPTQCSLEWCIEQAEGFDVEQCTGLKDKSGKLIYEGDIVTKLYVNPMGTLTDEIDTDFKYEIKFMNGCFGIETKTCFIPLQNFIDYHYGDYIPNCGNKVIYDDCYLIVIGNIHENKELLEV